MPVEEIVSSGPDRIIVYEGAEDKLKQLSSGVLEKLGVGGPSWEEQERERYRVNLVPVENQLASGQPAEQDRRRLQAAESQRFEAEEEMEYVELEDRRRTREEQRLYLDEPAADPYAERDQPQYEPEPPPRRVVPASRRPVQPPGEPLDVEPMADQPLDPLRNSSNDDLDDPW